MNKLRILPLAFLLWPAFASAACLPAQPCVVTTGTAVVGAVGAPCPDNNPGICTPFNFAGKDFSASGVLTDTLGHLPFGLFFNFDSDPFLEFFGAGPFELTVKGVPWGIPAGGDAVGYFIADLGIPAPEGTWSVPFSFEGFFTGAPEPFPAGLGCDVLNCVNLEFRGAGILSYDVVGSPFPGWFEVGFPETFTFAAVPEPATLSLFALGLAGVGFMRRRKAIFPWGGPLCGTAYGFTIALGV